MTLRRRMVQWGRLFRFGLRFGLMARLRDRGGRDVDRLVKRSVNDWREGQVPVVIRSDACHRVPAVGVSIEDRALIGIAQRAVRMPVLVLDCMGRDERGQGRFRCRLGRVVALRTGLVPWRDCRGRCRAGSPARRCKAVATAVAGQIRFADLGACSTT